MRLVTIDTSFLHMNTGRLKKENCMYVRQVDRDEGGEVAKLQERGQQAQHISHQSDIDRRRKGQGGGTDSLVTFKEEERKGQRPF